MTAAMLAVRRIVLIGPSAGVGARDAKRMSALDIRREGWSDDVAGALHDATATAEGNDLVWRRARPLSMIETNQIRALSTCATSD